MKVYRGIREPICHVRVLDDADAGVPSLPSSGPPPLPTTQRSGLVAAHELAVPRELISSALVPFDWGLDGAGSHYLAVALLADLLGVADRPGIKSALPFMRRFLSRLPREDFEIAETVFRAFIHAAVAPSQRTLPGKQPEPSLDSTRSGSDKTRATAPRAESEPA